MRTLASHAAVLFLVLLTLTGCSKKPDAQQAGGEPAPGQNATPTPGKAPTPVAANLKLLTPRTQFVPELSARNPSRKAIDILALSPNGSRVIVSRPTGIPAGHTQVWTLGEMPTKAATIQELLVGLSDDGTVLRVSGPTKNVNVETETCQPTSRPFVGSRVRDDNSSKLGFRLTQSESLHWYRPDDSNPVRSLHFYRVEFPSEKQAGTVAAGDGDGIRFAEVINGGRELPISQPHTGKVRLFDLSTKTTTREFILANPRENRGSARVDWSGFTVSPDGKWVAVRRAYLAKEPDPVEIFDGTGAQVATLPALLLWEVHGQFLPGRAVYVARVVRPDLFPPFTNADIAVYDINSKSFTAVLRGLSRISGIAVSADGKVLAAGNSEGTVAVWDLTQLP